MIEVHNKIWIPKQKNKLRVLYYSDDVDGGILYYNMYGETLFKPNLSWGSRNIDDVILFCKNLHL